VFSESCCQISTGLTYAFFIAGFAYEPAYATFVVVLYDVIVFRSGLLVYCICAFKCYLEVRMFEEVSNFPDLGIVVCKGNPFLALVLFCWLEFCFSFFISIFQWEIGGICYCLLW
jgi:hypothetical protein